MRSAFLLAALVLLTPTVASPALAQTGFGRACPGPAGLGTPCPGPSWPGSSIGDQHRREMDRLRANAEAQEALARRQRLDTRLTLLRLQAARPTAPDTPALVARSPEEERAVRAAASGRLRADVAAVAQIDDWLYRPRP